MTPLKLQEILNLVKEALIKTNLEYDILIKRLHLYYDMKPVLIIIHLYSANLSYNDNDILLHLTFNICIELSFQIFFKRIV